MRAFAIDRIPVFFEQILPGLWVTLEYVGYSFLLGLILGGLLAIAKVGKHRILQKLAFGYTTVMRCTPSIVLLFLVYYGLPRLVKELTGIAPNTMHRMKYIVITLTLFAASSLSEVFRSAYESLEKTQAEAADSIGMTKIQGFWYILMPQMLYRSLPNLCNTVLMLLKEGALAYTIGVLDLLGKGMYVIGQNQGSFSMEVYSLLAVMYWPIAGVITGLTGVLERTFNYNKKDVGGKKLKPTSLTS